MTTIPGGDGGALVFAAPGPGHWQLDQTHLPKPSSAYCVELWPEAFFSGFSDWMRRYGTAGQGLRPRFVHGFMYTQLEPADPAEFPERIAAAAETFETKRWRIDLERWEREVKPASIERHLEILAVDPAALDDEALISYLERCRGHHAAMITQHHVFNGACIIPLGDFLNAAGEWTGLPHARLAELFSGSSPESSSETPELRALVEALRADPAAHAIALGDDDPVDVLTRLRTHGGGVSAATERWLAIVGHRLLEGFDVANPVLLERPHVLISVLRTALDETRDNPADHAAELAARVRADVPDEHRAAFDALYEEARATYRLRDERGVYGDVTAAGLMRRAMRAAGDRLAARGRLDDPLLALDAGFGELCSMLRGDDHGTPTNDELRARARHREHYSVADAPPSLGDDPEPPPPLDMLPPPMARVMGATFTFLGHLFGSSEAEHDERLVRGISASSGVYEGTARVVLTIDDLDLVEPGDVLVALTTAESANCALSFAGAVVTDHGGALSHAAIMAREYGIPAVVGTREATSRIPDGARIRVDGTAGEVTWS